MTTMKRVLRPVLAVGLAGAAVALGHAYSYSGHKWGKAEVPYYVNPSNSDVSASAAITAIQAAAAAWSMQSNANFTFYYMGQTSGKTVGNNGKNEVFFRQATSTNVAETYRYWNSAGTLVDTDIVFYDASWQFFAGSSGCSGGFYITEIATHEFGHALGLNHSSISTATMYSGAPKCATWKSSLDPDDLAGVEKLYPPGGTGDSPTTNTAPAVTISSPATNTTIIQGATLTFSGTATDSQDGNLSSKLAWSSNLDGTFGTGSSVSRTLSPGTHTVKARVTDSGGLTSYKQITVYVVAKVNGITLSATGYKTQGFQYVNLKWSGATSTKVDIRRDGSRIATTANDGAHTNSLNRKGRGTYTYIVCESGTTVCSSSIVVRF